MPKISPATRRRDATQTHTTPMPSGARPESRPLGRGPVVARSLGEPAVADTVLRFVERTTVSSGVPVFVEDASAIEQIARVLA